jgi:transposase
MVFFMPAPFRLSPPERRELKRISRSQSRRADDVRRVRIILGLAGGQTLAAVSRSQSCSVNTVKLWRDRFLKERISGLWGRHLGKAVAPGTERLEARIIDWTLHHKPADGSTHWSSRKLAAQLGVSHMRVARVWAKAGLQPSRRRHYMASDDPAFESKAADIIGLYLKPPAHAAVFCVDEKSAIQALDRLDPVLPLSPGRAERHGFEYFRHGTLSLYAALEVSSGQVLGKTTQRHTSAQFVAFLADVVATQPRGKQIHVIADNLSAHKTKAVAEFLAAHTNIQLHYTPTYSSWLNQVEIWFSKIQRDLITRGIFTSKADLARKIARYIRVHNKSASPSNGPTGLLTVASDETIRSMRYSALKTHLRPADLGRLGAAKNIGTKVARSGARFILIQVLSFFL